MLQRLLRPETVVYLSILIFFGIFLVLYSLNKGNVDTALLIYYARQAEYRILWLLAFLLMFVFFKWGFVLFLNGVKGVNPASAFSYESVVTFMRAASRLGKNILLAGIPMAFGLMSFSFALGQLNVWNSGRLRDELLVRWDIFLTGTFPSLSLASLNYPDWFVTIIDVSFVNLVLIFALFTMYLFQGNQSLYRELAAAFFIAAFIMYAGWLLFPAMSPHDRSIDNVRDLPRIEPIQQYLEDYNPHPGVAVFLEDMRAKKDNLNVLPTSTMPSAHVAWAVLLVYYSYLVRRWLLLFTVPFAVFSTIGTVLFAQHYFVDIPAGIIVAVVSIAIASMLASRQKNREVV